MEYNGWKNYATWNVTLWVANEEYLYQVARDYVRLCRVFGDLVTWDNFLDYAGLKGGRTGDDVLWHDAKVSRMECRRFLQELVD